MYSLNSKGIQFKLQPKTCFFCLASHLHSPHLLFLQCSKMHKYQYKSFISIWCHPVDDSFREHNVHTQMARAGHGTLTALAGGDFVSGWRARVQAARRSWVSPAIEGWGHYIGWNLLFPHQLERTTGNIHAQTTATAMHQVNYTRFVQIKSIQIVVKIQSMMEKGY